MLLSKTEQKMVRFYWVFTEFQTRIDLDTNSVIGYTAHRKTLSDDVTKTVENLYAQVFRHRTKRGHAKSGRLSQSTFKKKKDEEITFVNLLDHIYKFY